MRTYVNTPVHVLAVYTVRIQNERSMYVKNTCIHTQQHPQLCLAQGMGHKEAGNPLAPPWRQAIHRGGLRSGELLTQCCGSPYRQ